MPPVAHASDIKNELTALREQVDVALRGQLEFDSDCPDRLADAVRYVVLAPGKRLRPLLAILAARACGGSADAAMPAACAVELIHAYSLVHDDLPAMDDDDLRRGLPTCHKAYDEATAILVGDALQARAFEILSTQIAEDPIAAKSCRVLAHAAGASQLVGGQVDDLAGQATGRGLEALQAIHRRKTGAMILASLRLGAISAGASDDEILALDAYGQRFGMVFQITDDLLDAQGDADEVGKRVGKDDDRGKLTYPGLLGIDESQQQVESLTAEACEALAPFGAAAEPLVFLAQQLVGRTK